MVLQFFKPHPRLSSIINNIMINEYSFDPSSPKIGILFPPLPEQCLFFYPYDQMDVSYDGAPNKKLVPCALVGPQTAPVHITMGYRHLVIKVGFQPGGLHRFLGIPMQQLLQREAFDAGALLGKEVYLVHEQLQSAHSFEQMASIVNGFFLSRLNKAQALVPVDHVLPLLIKHGGLMPIDKLARRACLSNRQFERAFKERIGLSPKFFSRIVRFANAWVLKESQPDTSWTDIAHRCGYFDQMHLVRDFKEFAGANPSIIGKALANAPVNLHNQVFS